MATTVTIDGVNYSVPALGDTRYVPGATGLNAYLIAIATAIEDRARFDDLDATIAAPISGPYVLTSSSKAFQVLTPTTTIDLTMPSSGLRIGMAYRIVNLSSNAITVKAGDATTIATVTSGVLDLVSEAVAPATNTDWSVTFNGTTLVTKATAFSGAGKVVTTGGADRTLGEGTNTEANLVSSTTTLTADKVVFGDGTKVVKVSTVSKADLEDAWTSFTPTVTAETGTYTTVTPVGRYKKIGKLVHYDFNVYIANAGTAGGAILVDVPVTFGGSVIPAGSAFTFPAAIQGFVYFGGVSAYVKRYDGSTPWVTGETVYASVTYEAT